MSKESIVETVIGKVRGRVFDGIHHFKGIPYGASPAGTRRFLPPTSPIPWAGIRDAFQLPPLCPQQTDTNFSGADRDFADFIKGAFEPQPYMASEDCLALNVWTPVANSARKRPVMVWLHGGGFELGSGGGAWNDGANLSRRGDLVVVSVNHRLSILGYLHLDDHGGDRYAGSGNAGMLDLILALKWVRDNISAFGGDPGNVTIFGSSGGGSKVNVLLSMPAARGLFHKAIVQSSYTLRMMQRDEAAEVTERFLLHLGVRAEELHDIPVMALLAAVAQIKRDMSAVLGRRGFCPVVDGHTLPMHPFTPAASELSATIPLLIGTTRDETRLLLGGPYPRAFDLGEEGLVAGIKSFTRYEEHSARKIIDAYRREKPDATPSDLFFAITTDLMFKIDAMTQAERKAVQGKAPIYLYQFDWEAPTFGRKYRAAHGIEVPFVFANCGRAPGHGGNDFGRAVLEDKVSGAWINFAHNGDPNYGDLPLWPCYSTNATFTMVFDEHCYLRREIHPVLKFHATGLPSALNLECL